MPGSASADVPSVSNRGGSLFANVTNDHTLVFGTATDYVSAPAKLIDKSSGNVWNDDFTLVYGTVEDAPAKLIAKSSDDIWNDDFTLVYATVEDLGSVAVNPSAEPTIKTASMSHFPSNDFKNWF